MSRKPPASETVYQITVMDFSHLGGPMGTEYTTVIETRLAGTLAAVDRLWAELKKKYRVRSNKLPDLDQTRDFGHVGFQVTVKRVEN